MRLDLEMVRRHLVPSRAAARRAIREGRVTVEGAVSTRPATGVEPDTPVDVDPEAVRYVSRAGHKLAAALERFRIDPRGVRCLDVGASTGGFTDCLLQRGARSVVAVDVGTGQLHPRLRRHPRVVSREGTDIRTVDVVSVGGVFPLVVVDVAFISLTGLTATLAGLTRPGGDLVALVKPQFEVGRDGVGRTGVVGDGPRRRTAVRRVLEELTTAGFTVEDQTPCPLPGTGGNREELAWLRRDDEDGSRG